MRQLPLFMIYPSTNDIFKKALVLLGIPSALLRWLSDVEGAQYCIQYLVLQRDTINTLEGIHYCGGYYQYWERSFIFWGDTITTLVEA